MRKLAGGAQLECGHLQIVSQMRMKLASDGYEQRPVWCIDCNDWSRLAPQENSSNDEENVLE